MRMNCNLDMAMHIVNVNS